jgi:hypothetical protein
MERAGHQLVRKRIKDPPGQGESVEGGSATRQSCRAPRTLESGSAEPPATSIGPNGQERSDAVAVPLTSELAAAEVPGLEGGMVAAGQGGKSKPAEYRCATCGYGIIVYGQPPTCPMCRESSWRHAEGRHFSQLLDVPLAGLARSVGRSVPRLAREAPKRARTAGRA